MRVWGFRVWGFRVWSFRVLGFGVSGFRVLGFQGLEVGVLQLQGSGFSISAPVQSYRGHWRLDLE